MNEEMVLKIVQWLIKSIGDSFIPIILSTVISLLAHMYIQSKNKPKIVIEATHEELEIRKVDPDWKSFKNEKSFVQVCILLDIVNKGKTTANNIKVKISRIIQGREEKINLLRKDWYPIPECKIENIQNGEVVQIKLFEINKLVDEIFFDRFDIRINRDNFEMEILVTGDNFMAFKKWFKYVDNIETKKIRLKNILTFSKDVKLDYVYKRRYILGEEGILIPLNEIESDENEGVNNHPH